VTSFDSVLSNAGSPTELGDVVRIIVTGDKQMPAGTLADHVEAIRARVQRMAAAGSTQAEIKKAVGEAKKGLPAVAFSGLFEIRLARAIREHSGLICADVDHLTVEQLSTAKRKLRADPSVVLAFISPTGTGLKVLLAVSGIEQWMPSGQEAPPDEFSRSANQFHGAAFDWVNCHMKSTHTLEIDPSGKDSSRLCFLSHDPEAIVNWDAVPRYVDRQMHRDGNDKTGEDGKSGRSSQDGNFASREMQPGTESGTAHRARASSECEDTRRRTRTKHSTMTEGYLRDLLAHIAAHDRPVWMVVLGAIKLWGEETGDEDLARAIADEWAQSSDKYDEADQERTWASLTRGPDGHVATVGTLHYLAKQHGWEGLCRPSAWFAAKYPGLSERYGRAVLEVRNDRTGKSHVASLNESFFAAALGSEGSPDEPAVYSADERRWFAFDPNAGVYNAIHPPALEERISKLMLECARACKHESWSMTELEFTLRKTHHTSRVVVRAEGLLSIEAGFWRRPAQVVPCRNGILDLNTGTLLPFSPAFHFRGLLGMDYRPGADCPQFKAALGRSLKPDDIDLLQRFFGCLLIGRNDAQKMLLLIGAPQTGKGLVCRVATAVVGAANVATLRTRHLGDRFEIGRLVGKLLIYGPDVPANFLSSENATTLKAITGQDPMSPEFKGSNATPPAAPVNALILLTSNNRLRIRLEDDVEAWRRRLVVISFDGPAVGESERVVGLSEQIVAAEGAGILNWAIEGLRGVREDSGDLFLGARQKAVRDALLEESMSFVAWARERLVKSESTLGYPDLLLVGEAFADYVSFCGEREWSPLPRKHFTRVVAEVIAREFAVSLRHDLHATGGLSQRGWKGISLAR
jgi:P4 family phage/plasmid primase-like protien